MVDGRETVGKSLGTTGWTDGKPWEIAWGTAPLEGSEMEATIGWTDGKPWEIACGELRCEGARRK